MHWVLGWPNEPSSRYITYTCRQINLYRMFFRRFLGQFSTDFYELFETHSATTVEYSQTIVATSI